MSPGFPGRAVLRVGQWMVMVDLKSKRMQHLRRYSELLADCMCFLQLISYWCIVFSSHTILQKVHLNCYSWSSSLGPASNPSLLNFADSLPFASK